MKNILLILRSLLFSLGMIIATIVHATLSLFTFPFPFIYRYKFITLWSRFIVWWLKITCGIHYQIHGLENISGIKKAVVLSKHQSTWETLAFQVFLPVQTWALKKELLHVPFFGWALSLLEPIAINRKAGTKALEQLEKQGKEKLSQDRWIIIFPEGTRTKPGEQKTFSKSGALLAKNAHVPAVPISHNAGLFWPRKGFIKHPGTIQVYIGPAINTQTYSVKEINDIAKHWIDTHQ